MQYARLGNTGLIVSRLAFGAMTFGSGQGALGKIWTTSESVAQALVDRALDAGVNFFDVADSYAEGESEIILGKALKSRRQDIVISTKVGFRFNQALIRAGASYGYVVSAAEASLRRLNTDYIDLLSIHRYDPCTPFEETARALEDLVRRGLVRYVGYSNFTAWQAAKFLGIQERMGYSRFAAAQMYYSLVGRDLEHEIVPFAIDAGIGIVVWSPLAGGFLSGRYTRQDPSGGKGRLASFDFIPIDLERGFNLLDRMKEIAGRHGASVAQVALGWLLAKPYVTSILLGASKTAQLEDNLGAADLTLTSEEVADLDSLTASAKPYPLWFQEKTADTVVREALEKSSKPKPAAAAD